MRQGAGRGNGQSSKHPSDASEATSQRASKDMPAFAEFDRPTRRGSLAMPVAPRRADNPADDVCRLLSSALQTLGVPGHLAMIELQSH